MELIYLGAVWPFLIIYQPAPTLHVLFKTRHRSPSKDACSALSLILDISRLYNLRQLTAKLMNSKWGPIKDCGWHFLCTFCRCLLFPSSPRYVAEWSKPRSCPTKGSCNSGNVDETYHIVSIHYLACHLPIKLSPESVVKFIQWIFKVRWSRSGSIETSYSTWNQVNQGNLSQWIIISFEWWYWTRWRIISPKQSLFDCLDLIAAVDGGLGSSHGFRCLIIDPSNTNVELWQALFAYDHCIRSQS